LHISNISPFAGYREQDMHTSTHSLPLLLSAAFTLAQFSTNVITDAYFSTVTCQGPVTTLSKCDAFESTLTVCDVYTTKTAYESCFCQQALFNAIVEYVS
jgi:hypothetical protein